MQHRVIDLLLLTAEWMALLIVLHSVIGVLRHDIKTG